MATPRWEGDRIGAGVGDAGELAPAVRRLLDEMVLPDWVTEDPARHLLPALTAALDAPGARFRLVDDVVALAVYVVTLAWQPREGTIEDLRRDVFALVGAVARQTTHVHERADRDRIDFDVVTGALEGQTRFRTHGFMLRLRIVGNAAKRLALDGALARAE
ncbi:MAG: hypothetical protein ICV64_07560 [Thermoleophilia bacterium]|nr:hypothetical protein [Thermoleophilia bacterium]